MKKPDNQVFGIMPVKEALNTGKSIDKLFMQQDIKSDQINEIRQMARNLGVAIIKAPREKLNKLCRHNHQGVVAFTSPIEFGLIAEVIQNVFEKGETPLILMLDKVNDVRNFGSIARSATCAGCHAIIIPHKGAAAINEESIKTSAGALYHIPVCKVMSLGDTIKELRLAGVKTIACSEKAEKSIYETDLVDPVCLLFGNEGDGIDPHLLRMSQEHTLIPMKGDVASLNVAVATAICAFEAQRQRLG